MEWFKEAVAIAGSLIGVISACITIYAKFVDMRIRWAKANAANRIAEELENTPQPGIGARTIPVPVQPDPALVESARSRVRGPAAALICAGVLGFGLNVLFIGFMALAEVGANSRMASEKKLKTPEEFKKIEEKEQGHRKTSAIVFTMNVSSLIASAMTIWAGFNMFNLRSYWLSMAGSFAVMPGTCLCCMLGVPIGGWSLFVLMKPEVKSAFS